MDYLDLLKEQFNGRVDLIEKRPGIYQLIAPLYHEDGDMVELFLEKMNGNIKVCDYGMTLMRLSYDYDIDTENKEKIFQKILDENSVKEEDGNIFLEADETSLYPSILQLWQVIAKITNMRQFKREVVQSLFYEMLNEFVEESLIKYNPRQNIYPIRDRDDLEVDWELGIKPKPIFLFGVKDTSKARLATISCLEFQRANIPFKSFLVHENFDSMSKKDRRRITSAADKQFTSLDDFRENGIKFIEREVA